MPEWRKLTNESKPEDTRFYEGLDTGTLYYKSEGGFFIILVGRGEFKGRTGDTIHPDLVRGGRGVRMITAGTKLEITL